MTIGMLLRGYRNTVNEFFAESGNFYTFEYYIDSLFFLTENRKKAGKNFKNTEISFLKMQIGNMPKFVLLLGV